MYSDAEILERIVRRLTALGMSERKACQEAGIGVDAIRDIRRGRTPRVEVIVKLSKVLECRLEWLLTGEGPETDEAPAMTPRQRALLDLFSALPPEDQDRALRLARALAEPADPAIDDRKCG
ncbi:helix-turn-helix domain-containing protein [Pararhodospirillum photometricum]|uniref:helix-turn-helix domain-containing protein n=1 Tax=Pararhodospirillum photometricum TaxID=1084 RepID=UPI0005A205A7